MHPALYEPKMRGRWMGQNKVRLRGRMTCAGACSTCGPWPDCTRAQSSAAAGPCSPLSLHHPSSSLVPDPGARASRQCLRSFPITSRQYPSLPMVIPSPCHDLQRVGWLLMQQRAAWRRGQPAWRARRPRVPAGKVARRFTAAALHWQLYIRWLGPGEQAVHRARPA